MINFDPCSIKASDLAIIEYNRLRKIYRPDLLLIKITKENRIYKVQDTLWTIPKKYIKCQTENNQEFGKTQWKIHGLYNYDGVSCYSNVVIQCFLHCDLIREKLYKLENNHVQNCNQ